MAIMNMPVSRSTVMQLEQTHITNGFRSRAKTGHVLLGM